MNLLFILSIGFGGFFGAISRFAISTGIHKILGSSFPYGTLTVNVLGSFVIGFLFLYFEQTTFHTQKAFLVTGFLGALTTFSTFSIETVLLMQQNLYTKALANASLNLLLCFGATMAGIFLFHRIYGI